MNIEFVKNEALIQCFSERATMILSNDFNKANVLRCFELGISAFFSRDISPDDLESILNDLISDSDYSNIRLEPKIKDQLTRAEPIQIELSEAEEAVLKLVCDQKSSAEISKELGISIRTVESRKRKMIKKTASKNMIGVIMAYFNSRHNGTFLAN
jgi:DNA-binding NarL/FixJ family response regulator